jgi:D-alanyl-lipoteichoic acid acyltransferase DltB (MBOAT superfamily)
VFFTLVLIFHYCPISWRLKKTNLLLASYLFYATWNPPFVVLLWISTLVDWRVAAAIHRSRTVRKRRLLLIVSLIVNLGLLGFFKYSGFWLENLNLILAVVNVVWEPPAGDIILPIGISFYTFQTLSYTLDVYFRRMQPWNSLLDYAMYVTFFPQLVAGPIVRARQFLPQCRQARAINMQSFGLGLALLTLGLFEKTVLADVVFAPLVEAVYDSGQSAETASAWMATVAFAGQLFCDFAGYSSCAVGIALCLGFNLPDNFRCPYAAVGFSDFWRRWHISLSTWLRDYLYIPLGGNRRGLTRTQANLFITMLLGGLWHGAAWTFVIWGGLHGVFLLIERGVKTLPWPAFVYQPLPARLFLSVLTFSGFCVSLVFFRADSLFLALDFLANMFGLSTKGTYLIPDTAMSQLAIVCMLLLLVSHWLLRDHDIRNWLNALPWPVRSFMLAGMLLAIILTPGDNRAFIYFQF